MCVLSASLVIRSVRNKLWKSAERCTWVLLVKTVPLFAVCFSHQLLLNSEPGQLQPHEELDKRAPLFVAIGSVCHKAGWRLSIGWPVKCGQRRGRNALSDCWCRRESLLSPTSSMVMYASRRLSARAHSDSRLMMFRCCMDASLQRADIFLTHSGELVACAYTTTFGKRR